MFYERRSAWTRLQSKIFRRKAFSPVLEIAAGMHAAHGLAHGVRPAPSSRARG